MANGQLALAFDASPALQPGPVPHLRDEIARRWGLPLGERVEINFHPAFPLTSIIGRLELRAAPARDPWDAREPLALRVAGQDFTTRDIERWKAL